MDHQHTRAPAWDSVVIDEIAGQHSVTLLVVDPLGFHGSLRRTGLQDHGGGQDERRQRCDFHGSPPRRLNNCIVAFWQRPARPAWGRWTGLSTECLALLMPRVVKKLVLAAVPRT